MIKIKLNEQFAINGSVYMFTEKDGKMSLKYVKPDNSKEVTGPPLEDVINHFVSNGYLESAAREFHKFYWEDSAGKDSSGKEVKNWKQKARSVWFKDKNKANTPAETGSSNEEFRF